MRVNILRNSLLLTALCGAFYACTISDGKKKDDDDSSSSSGITTMCEEQCIALHPEGEQAYRDLRSCLLCGACFDVCTAELGSKSCSEGMESGCSAMFSSCGECVNSTCALEQLPDTTFAGACAPAGQTCTDTPGCVTVNNCVTKCVAGGSGGAGGDASSTTGSGGSGGNSGL